MECLPTGLINGLPRRRVSCAAGILTWGAGPLIWGTSDPDSETQQNALAFLRPFDGAKQKPRYERGLDGSTLRVRGGTLGSRPGRQHGGPFYVPPREE